MTAPRSQDRDGHSGFPAVLAGDRQKAARQHSGKDPATMKPAPNGAGGVAGVRRIIELMLQEEMKGLDIGDPSFQTHGDTERTLGIGEDFGMDKGLQEEFTLGLAPIANVHMTSRELSYLELKKEKYLAQSGPLRCLTGSRRKKKDMT
ncbi:hypothetical protein NDU88_006007 [Pleurodeles waltl]|uniref:Uncharacterized protein n=1 Tax=Pleurodeles waltl TaxID=8319 RepID=A0AAV7PH36_PLEWA|nr:hypothetical protein NDU88_006007 [Pleurodeles waltl]